ncbi:MAG TPA: double-strand break repair helicase AddA [Caulobacterales bacterium]|nr:double-strand break repair helicase AddA [Caulobacterales bacterium]
MTPLEAANKAQRIAADPRASVFVTANAGSGKTKVLVDRIARLLLQGSKPSAFLCITYTKAAAAEMQRRLFERLGAWCVADDVKLAAELRALAGDDAPMPTHKELAAARALFARALETPGGLRIQTIHAFCERLLGRFPLEAGVAPGFDIADEARAGEVLRIARAACVLRGDPEVADAFARFATRLPNEHLEGLLNRLVLQRSDLLRHASTNIRATMRERHRVEHEADAFAARAVQAAPWSRLEEAEALLAASTAGDQKLARRIAAARADLTRKGPSRAALMSLARIVLKDDGEPYGKTVTKKLTDRHAWIERLFDDLATHVLAALEGLNAIDRAADAASALILAVRLDETYEAAKARLGVLDFEDLITHAHALLSRSDAAPWVLYKLDGGIDHILIDEGQDTSGAQWDLVAPLQNEFFAGAGVRETPRTVFAVGDPKQSIYAFQGADPDRFLSESQTLSARAHAAGQRFSAPVLETSFRSSPEILRVVDATFANKALVSGMQASDEIRHLAARANEPGVVELWPIARRPQSKTSAPWDAPLDVETGTTAPALLAKAVAKEARRWIDERQGVWEKGGLRPMHAGDILALVKKRGALFHELIKAFKRQGLAVAGADRMTLKDELAVEDCLALMRVALDPADDLALACVLKGPWCDLDDDDRDLFPLAHGRPNGQTLYERLIADDTLHYAAARAFVTELTARAGADAFAFLSWALETVIGPDERSGWERCFARLGAEARDPLDELLSRALKPSAYSAPSLQRFLYEIESDAGQIKREMEAAGECVRVMTVHGAKGLEAPVVILPDSTSPVSDRPEDGIIFAEDGPHLSPGERSDDAVTRIARAAYKERAVGEHLRLLYVAMTRARDRLIVCGAQHGNLKSGEAEGSWRSVVADAMARLGEPCDTPFGEGLRLGAPVFADPMNETIVAPPPLPTWAKTRVVGSKRVEIAAPSRMKQSDAVFSPRGDGQKRFHRGRLIHGLLERLPDVSADRRAAQAELWLKRQGVEAREAEALTREALAVIDDPQFAAAFSSSSRAEAPIVGSAAGRPVRGVVDRLAVDEGGVLVVDFKTDRPAPLEAADAPDAYLLQMALYRSVMRDIFKGKPVRCALVWTEAPHLMQLPDELLDRVFEVFTRG